MGREFSPSDREVHRQLGRQIIRFVDMMEQMTFFGPDVSKKERERLEKAWSKAREIGHKLEKGKGNKIFKDEDEWNQVG